MLNERYCQNWACLAAVCFLDSWMVFDGIQVGSHQLHDCVIDDEGCLSFQASGEQVKRYNKVIQGEWTQVLLLRLSVKNEAQGRDGIWMGYMCLRYRVQRRLQLS